jgi:hypothetical protein
MGITGLSKSRLETGILFTQRMKDSPVPPTIFNDFQTLAYGVKE